MEVYLQRVGDPVYGSSFAQSRTDVGCQGRQPDWSSSSESDEVTLGKRRRSRVGTPPPSGVVALRAPEKKRPRRLLPWTKQGRLRWPHLHTRALMPGHQSGEDWEETQTVVGDVEESQQGVPFVQVPDSQPASVEKESEHEAESESDSDGCSSFVVDDDCESVVQEERRSDRTLGRAALKELRAMLSERIERLNRRLDGVDLELEALGDSDDEV